MSGGQGMGSQGFGGYGMGGGMGGYGGFRPQSRSMPAFGGYGGDQWRTGGNNVYQGSSMQPQQSPQTGLPPWANQNMGGAQNPYSTVPGGGGFRMNPMGSGSGAGFNNFGQPQTGGQNTVQDTSMPQPSMAPRTGGNDPYSMAKPATYMQTGGNDYATGGMDPYSQAKPAQYQPPQTGGQDNFNQQQYQPMQAPQSWEQQNSQLLRPQQMQDPALAQQTPWGSPTAQSLYPGLTPQQLAQVNWIGSNPVGGGHALNDYLLSIRYPGALQPGQQIR
jgi:hypothetical protein